MPFSIITKLEDQINIQNKNLIYLNNKITQIVERNNKIVEQNSKYAKTIEELKYKIE